MRERARAAALMTAASPKRSIGSLALRPSSENRPIHRSRSSPPGPPPPSGGADRCRSVLVRRGTTARPVSRLTNQHQRHRADVTIMQGQQPSHAPGCYADGTGLGAMRLLSRTSSIGSSSGSRGIPCVADGSRQHHRLPCRSRTLLRSGRKVMGCPQIHSAACDSMPANRPRTTTDCHCNRSLLR
jgi:hypothetical protein